MSRLAERVTRLEVRKKEIEEKDNIRVILAPGDGTSIVIDFRDPSTHPWREAQAEALEAVSRDPVAAPKQSTHVRKTTRRKGRS